MAKHRRFYSLFILPYFLCINLLCEAFPSHGTDIPIKNLDKFSKRLLVQSEFHSEKQSIGVVLSTPFSVGYMLANFNVLLEKYQGSESRRGSQETSLNVIQEYSNLVETLNNANIQTYSLVFLRSNDSLSEKIKSSEELKKLKTEVRNIQQENRLRPTSFPFTTSTLHNYNNYRGKWDKRLRDMGPKQFSDGGAVPFLEIEGPLPVLEQDNFTAVALKLRDEDKYFVLVLPKEPYDRDHHDFSWTSLAVHPLKFWSTERSRKVLVPALNLTMTQPFWSFLVDVGIPTNICSDKTENQKGSYFPSPISQTNNLVLSSDGLDIQSITAAYLYSQTQFDQFLAEKGGIEGLQPYLNDYLNITTEPQTGNTKRPTAAVVKQRQTRSPSSETDTIQFNRPFYWYFFDEKLRSVPLYYGAVESLERYWDDIENGGGMTRLLELRSATAWFCPQLFNNRRN